MPRRHPSLGSPVGKPTLRHRWLFFRHWLDRKIGKTGAKMVRYAARNSTMLAHAQSEWKIAFPKKDEMQDAVAESVFDCVAIFSLEGHSGFSAGYTIPFVEKALRFEPFSPITGADDEWTHIGDYSGEPIYQNKRLSSVFKDGDGRAYDIDGKIYVEPNGATFTKGGERNYIEFPYTKPDPVFVHVDENGQEIIPFKLNWGWAQVVIQRVKGRQQFHSDRRNIKDAGLYEEILLVVEGLQKEISR